MRSRDKMGAESIFHVTAGAGESLEWPGAPLRSREQRWLSVQLEEAEGWSEPAVIEAGLLEATDWSACFVQPSRPADTVPIFRRSFHLDDAPENARLYVTYLGIGRFWVNGKPVTDAVLEPGWQSYNNRLVYRTHDVTRLLVEGDNEILAEVGPGWYSGRLGFFEQRGIYGEGTAVLAQLELRLASGEFVTVASDESWTWRNGPTISSDLYDGEIYDAREADEDRAEWLPVARKEFDLTLLEAPTSPPVRRVEEISPKAITRSPSGKIIVDFGRNVVGWVRITATGSVGTQIRLRHAEVLENDELGVRPLRTAAATDTVILAGAGLETWEPGFTYHGFRYVEVEGWPGEAPSAADLTAVVLFSDLPRAGWFRTSHTELARLHDNVVASMQGNFVSIPTDCPQRDERLGWTGDIAVFAPTATFLYDCSGFLRSWLRDVELEQDDDGRLPTFVPEVPFPPFAAQLHPQFDRARSAVWGDAATIVPFALYQASGDVSVLRDTFELMRRWVDGVIASAGDDRIWDGDFQFGDWLDPTAPPDDPGDGRTEPELIATAYLAHSARLVARAAAILGDSDSAEKYDTVAVETVHAFQDRFFSDADVMTSDSQTAYALALCLDLAGDGERRDQVATRLVELVRAEDHRIGTGFVGTPLILEALTLAGALDDAYAMLLRRDLPSWLYAVSMGATTIWERWDSMLPDGSINPGEMTSFNHYALGAVANWLHSTVAGMSAIEPGYRRIRIAPRPRSEVRDAGATHHTPFGPASVDWSIDGEYLEVRVSIPDGVVAVIDLEGEEPFERRGGDYTFRTASPVCAERSVHELAR